jgi:hypothetical protein
VRPGHSYVCTAGELRLGKPNPVPVIGRGYTPPEVNRHPEKQARLALALYREALAAENVAYEFLGYFKIINILHETGRSQKAWINNTMRRIHQKDAAKRIVDLQTQVKDVGEYLYESGRCAVAHAYGEPLVDPDDPKDLLRLREDMPVARALAEYLIEYELNVKRQ